jgi:hypothetical protein
MIREKLVDTACCLRLCTDEEGRELHLGAVEARRCHANHLSGHRIQHALMKSASDTAISYSSLKQ